MISITNWRQGALLNHNHGRETEHELTIPVEGISESGYPVEVNGVRAEMDGPRFFAEIPLTQKFNTVTATAITPYGNYSQELTLVWDKKSFKRCNFYIDDHSFVFTDLAKERPKSAFDHFYLGGLKKIHAETGFKVTLNCFYRNDHHPFELKDMPDLWKAEFIDNSDWLRFSFHSYSEFPDRPYAEATAEEFGHDWDLVQNEIIRFAGEQSYIPPVVIHWANIHPAVAQECIRRGMTCYSSSFRLRVMGGPSLADRQKGGNMAAVEQRSASGADRATDATDGFKLHYGFTEEDGYTAKHLNYYDPLLKIFFFRSTGTTCNLYSQDTIRQKFKQIFANADRYGNEAFNGGSHEQYTFPYYPNYIPDHLERIRTAVRCMIDYGCKPVFFPEGILGNTAWDK